MSSTWSLVCHETKQTLWIGQGNGQMSNFYYGEPQTMERLKRFLQATQGKSLVLLVDDIVHDLDYAEFEEPVDREATRTFVSQIDVLQSRIDFWKKACDDAHNLGAERLKKATDSIGRLMWHLDAVNIASPDPMRDEVLAEAQTTLKELS